MSFDALYLITELLSELYPREGKKEEVEGRRGCTMKERYGFLRDITTNPLFFFLRF